MFALDCRDEARRLLVTRLAHDNCQTARAPGKSKARRNNGKMQANEDNDERRLSVAVPGHGDCGVELISPARQANASPRIAVYAVLEPSQGLRYSEQVVLNDTTVTSILALANAGEH